MRTPAGSECPYFYGDYYRGRNHEECRLLLAANPPEKWTRNLCASCPVPGIARANACEHMVLTGHVARPVSAVFQRRVQVTAFCRKSNRPVKEPHVGCGECHPFPPVFEVKK